MNTTFTSQTLEPSAAAVLAVPERRAGQLKARYLHRHSAELSLSQSVWSYQEDESEGRGTDTVYGQSEAGSEAVVCFAMLATLQPVQMKRKAVRCGAISDM